MDELNLYELFKQILEKSKVIEGRFHVATNHAGNDINTENLNEIVKDALGAITSKRKYPLCILLPPVDEVDNYIDNSFSSYTLTMYFLTQAFNGSNGIKSPNFLNNTSDHSIPLDWKDMRECAMNFRKAFIKITDKPGYKFIRDCQSKDLISRVSNMGNDNLNGVKITFDIELFTPCQLTDYSVRDLEEIKINLAFLHPLHKH